MRSRGGRVLGDVKPGKAARIADKASFPGLDINTEG